MNTRNNRYEICLASNKDTEEIRQVFESDHFGGGIEVQFLRNPDPYASMQMEGERAVIVLLKDKSCENKVIGVGACIIRRSYIGGEIKRTGYLTGLKILPEFRKKVRCIPQCYKFLYENTRGLVDVYFTTILSDNIYAQKLLEKKRKNMPRYLCLGNYSVYCFKAHCRKDKRYSIVKGKKEEFEEFYKTHTRHMNFTSADFHLASLKNEDFYGLYKKEHLIGVGAVLDQNSYKQYIIKGYNGIYKYLSKLPTKLLGYPSFPKVNKPVNYGCISFLFVNDKKREAAGYFIKQLCEINDNYDFLMLGLHEEDPLNETVKIIKHVKYQSKVYLVSWDDEVEKDANMPNIKLEVGLL